MSHNVIVVAEARSGAVKRPSLEAVAAGAALASQSGGEVIVVIAGHDLAAAAASLKSAGAAKVITVEHDSLANFSSDGYADALTAKIVELGAGAILGPHSAMGKEVMPRIAAALETGLITDVTAVSCEGGTYGATKPVYAGKALLQVQAQKAPFMATLRPNAFEPKEGGDAAIETAAAAPGELKAVVKEMIAAASDRTPLQEAKVVVAGGRGMKEPEHFKLIEELAEAFGPGVAAVGASRAVVDAGWRPHREQVGQTGKVVAPSLYIAAGISGAIQHLAGMRTARTIVAINKDAEAPIFKVADYGIVGDVFEVLPALTEAIKAASQG